MGEWTIKHAPRYRHRTFEEGKAERIIRGRMTDKRAELYDHMEAVAKANGFDSLTDAIVYAVKCRELVEMLKRKIPR